MRDWDGPEGVESPRNVVLVSVPSFIDPDLAPEGKHVLHAYVECRHPPPTHHHPPLTTHHLPPTTRHPPPTTHHLRYVPATEPYEEWAGMDRNSEEYKAKKEEAADFLWKAVEEVC